MDSRRNSRQEKDLLLNTCKAATDLVCNRKRVAAKEGSLVPESPPFGAPAGPTAAARSFVLIVRPRSGPPRRVALDGEPVTIGRAAIATIVLADPTVSGVHARIDPAGGGHEIFDCSSRNGTRVNRVPIDRRPLSPGDVIEIGGASLTYAEAGSPLDALDPRPPAPGAPLRTLLEDDTSTVKVAPEDFEIDFAEPKTAALDNPEEAQAQRQLVALYRAAKLLTPVRGGSPVELRFVDLARSLVGANRVGLFRVHPSATPEIMAGSCGEGVPSFEAAPPSAALLREAQRNYRALVFCAPRAGGDVGPASKAALPSSAIAVPIPLSGDPLLVAYADAFGNWPPFEAEDLRVFGIVARHASACIENQRARAALVAANENLERRVEARTREVVESAKLAAVGTLASGIAHEFNNLLYVILGNAEIAARTPGLSADGRERIETILEVARRSRDIVADLLTFAHRREPRREKLRVAEVVDSGLRLMKQEFARAKVALAVSLGEVPDVLGDAGQLTLAVVNLLKNAKDAIVRKGGGAVSVRLSFRTGRDDRDARVVIEVQDDGIGMAPEVRARLFEPFFTTKQPGEGTGLGLSITWGIIENHGGTIEVESEAGAGATFRVVLPAAPRV
jgi:signal transduction histidine kinase